MISARKKAVEVEILVLQGADTESMVTTLNFRPVQGYI
jgi:hypothetical protein